MALDRVSLIARKHAVRSEIEQTQRALEQARAQPDSKSVGRRIGRLEDKLARLMAEEYSLRMAIDRAGKTLL